MNCGEPEPPYCNLAQDDVGNTDALCDRLDVAVAAPATTSAAPTITASGIPKRIRFFTFPPWFAPRCRRQVSGFEGQRATLNVSAAELDHLVSQLDEHRIVRRRDHGEPTIVRCRRE